MTISSSSVATPYSWSRSTAGSRTLGFVSRLLISSAFQRLMRLPYILLECRPRPSRPGSHTTVRQGSGWQWSSGVNTGSTGAGTKFAGAEA